MPNSNDLSTAKFPVAVAFITMAEITVINTVDKTGTIRAFETVQEGIDYFELGYRECHERGYEWSGSATFNWLIFQPTILQIESEEDLISFLEEPYTVAEGRHMSGRMFGLKVKKEKIDELTKRGIKPSLIGPRTTHSKQKSAGNDSESTDYLIGNS